MQIQSTPVSRVYAEALFRSAQSQGLVASIDDSLQGLAAMMRENPQFQSFLRAPMISAESKKAAVVRALKGKVEDLLVDFLCLLIDKDRAAAFEGIVEQFRVLADRAAGRVRVGVRTSHQLTDVQRSGLEQSLQDILQRDCTLETKVEPDLIGGMVLRVGDKLYDGSVRRQLQRVGAQLMRSSGYED